MVYYLDNNDKFLLYNNSDEVVFVLYSMANKGPMVTLVRWLIRDIVVRDALQYEENWDYIVNHLQNKDPTMRIIGKALLEESLKVKIHGEIVGHREK